MPEQRRIALDATYSIGENLTGVGVYSREILYGLAARASGGEFQWCFRSQRFLRSFREKFPPNCRRFLLQEPIVPRRADLFHGLNQRAAGGPAAARGDHLSRPLRAYRRLLHSGIPPPLCRSGPAGGRGIGADHRVSEFTASQVEKLLGVDRDRLRVVHHGVRIPPESAIPREKIVLHVGALQKRKNIVRLVQAFEALPSDWRSGAGRIVRIRRRRDLERDRVAARRASASSCRAT